MHVHLVGHVCSGRECCSRSVVVLVFKENASCCQGNWWQEALGSVWRGESSAIFGDSYQSSVPRHRNTVCERETASIRHMPMFVVKVSLWSCTSASFCFERILVGFSGFTRYQTTKHPLQIRSELYAY